MSMFKEWRSIENHYNRKVVDKLIAINPELYKETFLVTEKIDGANFSFTFKADGTYEVNKRSGKADDNFYNWKSLLLNQTIKHFIYTLSLYTQLKQINLQFVGELFGQGVQKRVYYGPDKYWKWYAIYEHTENGVILLTIDEASNKRKDILTVFDFDIDRLFVPIMTEFNLSEGEDFIEKLQVVADINKNSFLTPEDYKEPNKMEGVVARPRAKDYYHGDNEESTIFIVKYKSEAFLDKPKEPKKPKVYTELFSELFTELTNYVNENRTLDLMSKEGPLDDMKNFGKYLGFYMKDVMTDFSKTHAEKLKELSKEEQKELSRTANAVIAKELKSYVFKGTSTQEG